MPLTVPSPLLVSRLRKAGILHPVWTIQYAAMHKVPLDVACGYLMQESGGGANVFGHDPTIFVGAGTVTKAKYLAYAHLRDQTGECQGVGPAQLTSKGLQLEADELGGCYWPRWNIAVGMHYMGGLIARHPGNLHAGVAAYNGSGPNAERYADRVLSLAAHFRAVIGS